VPSAECQGHAKPGWSGKVPGSWYRLRASASRRLGVALLLSLVSVACAEAGTATDPMQALGLVAPNEAVSAPEFSLPDLAGKKVQLKTLRGSLVFLNFFATWCEPCREEMPGMERLFRTHKDRGFVVLAVNTQESAKAVRPFVQELKLSFPIALDEDGTVGRDYGVRALPVSFLIGRDGRILWRAIGGRDWESAQARKLFAELVAEKK
jgi:peroxiredoxin